MKNVLCLVHPKRVLVGILLLFLSCSSARSAGNETINVMPDSNKASFRVDSQNFWKNELPNVMHRYIQGEFVFSGFNHGPSGSCVSAGMGFEAYTNRGNRVVSPVVTINYGAANIGGNCSNDVCWVVGSPLEVAVIPGTNFKRSGNSDVYVDCVSDSEPQTPSDAVKLMKVILSGGAITATEDLRKPSSYARHGVYDVTDPLYGGIADDSTDIAPALNAAILAARLQKGGIVTIPDGTFKLSSTVAIYPLGPYGDGGVIIRGSGWNPPAPTLLAQNSMPRRGTWIHISSPSFNPFIFEASNITVENIAFDQDHPASTPGWVATNYPYIFTMQNPVGWSISDVNFKNLFFFKVDKGFHQASIAGQAGARINFYDIYGQFFREGIFLEFDADVSRFNNIHMWPFWSADADVMKFSEENLNGFRFWRVDNPNMSNIFVFGAKNSLYLENNPIAWSSLVLITNFGSDRSVRGLSVDQDNATIRLTNFYHASGGVNASSLSGSVGIFLNGTGNNMFATNVDILGTGSFCIGSTNSFFNITNLRCSGYNLANVGQPAIVISGSGSGSVSGYSHIGGGVGGTPEFFGKFFANDNPGGAYFNAARSFYAAVNVNDPTINFGPNVFLQYFYGLNKFRLGDAVGTYATGGLVKPLCIQDGVLVVCP